MRQFGDLESAVMDCMWDREYPARVREVLEDLSESRKLAYTTVMTVMDNLHRKGFLTREKDGRAYRYTPVKTREEYSADLMREVWEASADRRGTLVHFLDSMNAREVRQLRSMLDKAKRKRKR